MDSFLQVRAIAVEPIEEKETKSEKLVTLRSLVFIQGGPDVRNPYRLMEATATGSVEYTIVSGVEKVLPLQKYGRLLVVGLWSRGEVKVLSARPAIVDRLQTEVEVESGATLDNPFGN